LFHVNNNPYFENSDGIDGYSLALFNWSIVPWSLYALMGLIVAYFHFNKGRQLKLSSILPRDTNIWVKRSIDITMTLGIIGGLTTSLGLGVAQLTTGLDYVFGISINPYILMAGIEVIALWSVMTGLQRGMKWLSNATIILAAILLLAVFLIGKFGLDLDFAEFIGAGTGHFLGNFGKYMNVFDKTSDAWAAAWPVFYQLWYASWAAFVGVFVAKISKGRTFKEFIIGTVGIPSLMTLIWFGVFGRVEWSVADELYPLMQSDITKSLFAFLNMICDTGLYQVISGLVLLLLCMFFITSSDSGSYVVASMLTEKGPINPKDKLYWSIIECLMAMVLFGCGGLALIQSASVIMGIPVLLLMMFGAGYFIRTLYKDKNHLIK
jgi:choline-glycine betaine transporter